MAPAGSHRHLTNGRHQRYIPRKGKIPDPDGSFVADGAACALRRSPPCLFRALHQAKTAAASRDIACGAGGGNLFGYRRNTALSFWSTCCRQVPAAEPASGYRLGSRFAHCRRQPAVAGGQLDREHTFRRVTGDLDRILVRHSPDMRRTISRSLPGMLTSRVTATSNACSPSRTCSCGTSAPLHGDGRRDCIRPDRQRADGRRAERDCSHRGVDDVPPRRRRPATASRFADKAAAVDGENGGRIGNMTIVRAFGGLAESPRVRWNVQREGTARRRSPLSGEAAVPACGGNRRADGRPGGMGDRNRGGDARRRTGEVVLVCTLGLSILHATRDLAVALVDVT